MISPRVNPAVAKPATAGYLRVLREQWLIIVISVIVCVIGGQIGRSLASSSYTAESDLLISPVDPADDTFVGISVFRNISADPTSNSFTLARYLNTTTTANLVKQKLHLSDSPQALLDRLSLVPVGQTNILAIRANASSPQRAQLLANTFADVALQRRTQQVQADAATVIKRLQKQVAAAGNASSPQLAAVQQRLAALRVARRAPGSNADDSQSRRRAWCGIEAVSEAHLPRERDRRPAPRIRDRPARRLLRREDPARGRPPAPRPASGPGARSQALPGDRHRVPGRPGEPARPVRGRRIARCAPTSSGRPRSTIRRSSW